MSVHEDSVLLVTGGYDHHIRFWEASTALSSHTIQYNDSQLNALVISPDKRFLAAAGMKSVKLYDIARAQPVSVTFSSKS
jgi:G protein beta subunit-like protein